MGVSKATREKIKPLIREMDIKKNTVASRLNLAARKKLKLPCLSLKFLRIGVMGFFSKKGIDKGCRGIGVRWYFSLILLLYGSFFFIKWVTSFLNNKYDAWLRCHFSWWRSNNLLSRQGR